MVKKISGLVALMLTAAVLLLGCNNLAGSIGVGGGSDKNGTINFSVVGIDSGARTLAPNTLSMETEDGNKEIKGFVLSGTSETGKKFTEKFISVEQIKTTGGFEITGIPKDFWTFTLYAIDTAGAGASNDEVPATYKKLLKGAGSCDLTKQAASYSIAFKLSSIGLTDKGAYDIKLKYGGTSWSGTGACYWGLYDVTTGKAIGDQTTVSGTDSWFANLQGAGISMAGTDVTPGSYILKVTITNGATENPVILGLATEVLVIEPGRKTTGELNLDDNIIASRPEAPSNFVAQYINGSENNGNYYNVRFAWKDNSVNEESFEFLLKGFDATSAAYATVEADTESTDTAVKVLKFNDVFEGTTATIGEKEYSIRYVSGSLFAGSTELILSFPVGTMWDAQIRACNDIGKSVSVNRIADATTSIATKTDVSSSVTPTVSKLLAASTKVTGYGVDDGEATPAYYKHIALTKITYALDGGTLSITDNGTTTTYTGTYVEYKPYALKKVGSVPTGSESASWLPLLKEEDGKLSIKSADNIAFTKWILPSDAGDVDGAAKKEWNEAFEGDFMVIAVYGNTVKSMKVSVAEIKKLASEIFATSTITAKNGSDDVKNKYVVIGWGATTIPTIAVTITNTNINLFKEFSLYVDGKLIETKQCSGTGDQSFTPFSASRLKTGGGATDILVTATLNGDDKPAASQEFTIQRLNQAPAANP